ncbi:MAG: DUF483 domain-containing protein [Nanoarchaeota archaeon]|nr:DUF483 domain-containing protein [Nanoarchaeota archaeon]
MKPVEPIFQMIDALNLVLKSCRVEDYVPDERNHSEDMKKYIDLGVTPSLFVESLMTVFYNARKVSCCFQDQMTLSLNLHESIDDLREFAKNIKRDYDLFMGTLVFPNPQGFWLLFFFFKDYKYYDELEKIQQIVINDESSAQIFHNPQIIKRLGKLLGYPDCCIKFCLDSRKKGKSMESACFDSIHKIAKKKKGDELIMPSTFDSSPFLAFEFYPCSVKCKKAKDVGTKILKKFKSKDPKLAEAFQLILDANVNRIVNPHIKGEDVHEFKQETEQKIHDLFLEGEDYAQGSGEKNRVAAALLAILLGAFGAHKFYLGKPLLGILYALFFWTFIPSIVGIVEGVIYLMKTDEEFEEEYG